MAKNFLILSQNVIEDKYTCGICQSILENPHRPNVCSHVFCKPCLFNSFHQTSQGCPICRKQFNINKTVYEQKIDNDIRFGKFICNTCSNKVSIREYNQHTIYCSSLPSSTTTKSSLNSVSSQRDNNNQRQNQKPVINRHTFKCPYCNESNLTLSALRGHCNEFHINGEKNIVCPICKVMPWGDANLKSIDFIGHLNLRHKFEYDNYVEYSLDDEQMLQMAIVNSMKVIRT